MIKDLTREKICGIVRLLPSVAEYTRRLVLGVKQPLGTTSEQVKNGSLLPKLN